MRTRLLTSTNELAQVFKMWTRKSTDIRIVTAWATSDCALADGLRKARTKISTLVVGLDFHSTSPSFLQDFWSTVRIGEALNGGTFHPKLYLFRKGVLCCCVIGSSNFTSGGFGDNSELNIYVEGKASQPFFRRVSEYIDLKEEDSEKINSALFDDYKDRYIAFRSVRHKIAKFNASQKALVKAKSRRVQEEAGMAPPEQLNKSWPEFVNEILRGKRRQRIVQSKTGELSYLQTAERCNDLFARYRKLARMPVRDRQFVGGTIRESGWFGSMKGAGAFKRCLNDQPGVLDDALDRIPQKGRVTKNQFSAFVARYAGKRAGVATGSRLLAMKRPDLFICIDSKNRAPVAKAFGLPAVSLVTFDAYWELIQRVWTCPWWNTPEPKEALRRRIWHARVALLDSLYYLEGV